MKLYNSLTRQVEDFEPTNKNKVGLYTCGPTIYDYAHIGNWRTYILSDVLYRTLDYLGYEVNYVMNLTDVGHLTDDGDQGQDKLQEQSKKEGKTAWEIAEFYGKDFVESFDDFNLVKPNQLPKATDHIQEQIDLVKDLINRGYTYETSDGIYFDVQEFEDDGYDYGQLSNLDERKEGARVEKNPERKDPRDFALWKYSPKGEQRHMEWDSPWGVGFPGWHIECSAMSMKYLGNQFDIHVGGEDLRETHHPNEIAQSEGATGKKPFVKYWLHGAFLTVEGGKMSKSKGNFYTLHDIKDRGYDPLAYKYFTHSGHYRKKINFTWEAMDAAENSLNKLRRHVVDYKEEINKSRKVKNERESVKKVGEFEKKFKEAVSDDLNMPEVLAVTWEVVKSDLNSYQKLGLTKKFDQVLGLGLDEYKKEEVTVPSEVRELVSKRENLRKQGNYDEADKVREEIESRGFEVVDTGSGSKIKRKD